MATPNRESHRAFLERMEEKFGHYKDGTSFAGKPFLPGMTIVPKDKPFDIAFRQEMDDAGNVIDVPVSEGAMREEREERFERTLADRLGHNGGLTRGGRPVSGPNPREFIETTPLQEEAAQIIREATRKPNVEERNASALARLAAESQAGRSPATQYALDCLKPSAYLSRELLSERRRNGLEPFPRVQSEEWFAARLAELPDPVGPKIPRERIPAWWGTEATEKYLNRK